MAALDRLPGSGEFAVSLEQREQAERHLVELAQHHDAKALTVLGRRLFEVVAPDLADAYEGTVLTDEEALAARRCDVRNARGRRRDLPWHGSGSRCCAASG